MSWPSLEQKSHFGTDIEPVEMAEKLGALVDMGGAGRVGKRKVVWRDNKCK
jgi:hypothetical protein